MAAGRVAEFCRDTFEIDLNGLELHGHAFNLKVGAAVDVGCPDFVRRCADEVHSGPVICEAVSLRIFLGPMCMFRSNAAPGHSGEKTKKLGPWLSCEAPYSLAS